MAIANLEREDEMGGGRVEPENSKDSQKIEKLDELGQAPRVNGLQLPLDPKQGN